MSETNVVFDVSLPVRAKIPSPGGVKEIRLRFPNDEDWIERNRRIKTVTRRVGNEETYILNDPDEHELELLNKYRIGDDPECDEFDARQVFESIGDSEAYEDPVFEDGVFSIPLKVPGGVTKHFLRMMTSKELHQYKKHLSGISTTGKLTIYSINLAFGGDLYKKLLVRNEGYASGVVPIVHQVKAVVLARAALASQLGEVEPENF